jgi:hypothetical protein
MPTEGPRMLDTSLDCLKLTADGSGIATITSGSGTDAKTGNNWASIGNNIFATRKYYDLEGFTNSDLSLFFNSIFVQEAFATNGNFASVHVIDLVTTLPVSDDDITAMFPAAPNTEVVQALGFPRSRYDMSQVAYGRTRTFYTSTTSVPGAVTGPTGMYLGGETAYGTMPATANTRLYVCRIVQVAETAAATVNVPASNYVVLGLVKKEADIPYFMRMANSYEHALPIIGND